MYIYDISNLRVNEETLAHWGLLGQIKKEYNGKNNNVNNIIYYLSIYLWLI